MIQDHLPRPSEPLVSLPFRPLLHRQDLGCCVFPMGIVYIVLRLRRFHYQLHRCHLQP